MIQTLDRQLSGLVVRIADVKTPMIRRKPRDAHVDRRSHRGFGALDAALSHINHDYRGLFSSIGEGYNSGSVARKGEISDRPPRSLPEDVVSTGREIVQFDDARFGGRNEKIGAGREGHMRRVEPL